MIESNMIWTSMSRTSVSSGRFHHFCSKKRVIPDQGVPRMLNSVFASPSVKAARC
jgi:hypothetical protein